MPGTLSRFAVASGTISTYDALPCKCYHGDNLYRAQIGKKFEINYLN